MNDKTMDVERLNHPFFPELMLSYPFAKGKFLIRFYDRKKCIEI